MAAPKVHESGHSSEDLRQGVVVHTPEGTMRDRPLEEGPFDEFYISPEQKKEYGISPDEKPYWARDPEYWMKRGELVNRVKQLEGPEHREGMRARLIKTEDGEPVRLGGGTDGDLVLMTVPRELSDKRQAEIDAAHDEYQGKLRRNEDGSYVGREDTLDMDSLDARMREEHELNQMSGLIGQGSPTRGMSYTQAAAFIARTGRTKEVEARQEELRNNGLHIEMSDEAFHSVMSGRPDSKAKAQAQGKIQRSFTDSGFPRNPNSAVAQAARRQQRTGA